MAVTAPPLWDHQRQALGDLSEELRSAARVTGVMACGTGKTRVGAEVARAVSPSDPVLIVVPTLDLIAQTLAAWLEAAGGEALGRVIAVCGDREVVDREAADELRALRTEVTSDPGRLADLLRTGPGRTTVAVTYQSLPVVVAAHRYRGVPPWQLIVVDEAHRSAGLKARKWSAMHTDDLVPALRRLYLTATPRLVSVRDGRAADVISMDDTAVFGRVGHRLSFARAREYGLLADYQVVVCVVTDEDMHQLATQHSDSAFLQAGASAVSAPVLARQVALMRAAREFDVRRVLTYHRLVADTRWFAQTLLAADALLGPHSTLTTGHVRGGQNRTQRRAELAKLTDPNLERVVISNSRVLSEGYDAPAVDGVAFLDPRKSVVDTVQAVGRALRLGGRSEKTAYIFVPVLLQPGRDAVSALEDSDYGPVWQVLSALAAHDETLSADLRARRRSLGASRSRARDDRAGMPRWLQVHGVPVPRQFGQAITVKAVRSLTASWDEHVGALAAFAAEHGNLLVRADFVTPGGLALGSWVNTVRVSRKTGTLSPARQAQLDRLGMIWDVADETFMRHLAAAAAYRAEHGHLRIPGSYVTPGPDPIRLGSWISRLRSQREHLPPSRREALDRLGMIWLVFAEDWQQGIDAARTYHTRQGHLQVHHAHIEKTADGSGEFPLGMWLKGKRQQRKQLPPERIAELDALGMIWHPHDHTWRRNFTAAKAYHARHGHLNVPAHHAEQLPDGEVALGRWMSRQRMAVAAGTLSAERATALQGLGVKLERLSTWKKATHFAGLYRTRFGDLNVPVSHEIADADGEVFQLGRWISKARTRKNNGKMTPSQIAELDALGMVWDVHGDTWRTYYEAAVNFHDVHRHLDIPPSHVTGEPPRQLHLGQWIGRQRYEHKRGRLCEERIKELSELGMRWLT